MAEDVSVRVEFDGEYRPTPVLARLRREWQDRRGDASERVAWYVYDWANSVFSSVCITLFIPLFLTVVAQRAAGSRGAGSDILDECETSCTMGDGCPPPVLPGCRACVAGHGYYLWDGAKLIDLPRATVSFFGEVEAFTFATRVLSVSVAVQAIVFITFGAMADYGSWRKSCLVIATALGSGATIMFLAVGDPALYLMAAWLTVVANSCFGAAIVYYNAFLPILVEEHPEVQQSVGRQHEAAIRDEISNYMSSVGFGAGYLSGFLMVLIGVGVQLAVGNTAENQNLGDRLAISIGGVWWAAWSVWTILYLKPHPGKALPAGEWLLTKGWVSTAATLRQAASFPETFKFLIAYFLYSDSYSTIGYLGVLVMQQQMCLPSFLVGIVLLEVLAFAVAGNILSLRIQYHFNAQPKQMIFLALSGYVLLCGLGLLGLIPGSPIGLKTVPEAFIFGAVHGMMLGPVQSYSRTLFSDLVIPGKEAEFFALFEITDKGSSWLGPLVVGEVYRVTRSINAGFVYLMAMTAFPALLLLTVDHRKGMRQVRLLASQQRGDRPLMPHPHAAFEDAPSADSESRELEEPAGESLATHGRDDSPRAEAAGGGARSGRGGGDAGGLEGAGLAQHKGPG